MARCQCTVTGWGRKFVLATSTSVWQHTQLSEQMCPWDTLACWYVQQPTSNKFYILGVLCLQLSILSPVCSQSMLSWSDLPLVLFQHCDLTVTSCAVGHVSLVWFDSITDPVSALWSDRDLLCCWSCICSVMLGFFLFCFVWVFFFFWRSPAISLGFTTFGWDFCVCDCFLIQPLR